MKFSFYRPSEVAKEKAAQRREDAALVKKWGAHYVQQRNAMVESGSLPKPEAVILTPIAHLPNEGILP